MRFGTESTAEIAQNAPVGARFGMLPIYQAKRGTKLEVIGWCLISVSELQGLDGLG
jgi:hypothetical protein